MVCFLEGKLSDKFFLEETIKSKEKLPSKLDNSQLVAA
jgi:hypothetical protein